MDEVRAPMEFKAERLVERRGRPRKNSSRTRSSAENELADSILELDIEDALMKSMIEHESKLLEEERKKKEEQEQMELEKQRRQESFARFDNIRFQMKRVGKMDKEIQKLYEIIEPIIDNYCEDNNHISTFDSETYTMMIKNIRSIRLKKEEYDLLFSIIKQEE
jgi:hypothetical protein